MKRALLLATLLVAGGPVTAAPQHFAELRLQTSPRTADGEMQYARAQWQSRLEQRLGFGWGWQASLLAEVDGWDRLEPQRPTQRNRSAWSRRWLPGERGFLELRELYFDARLGPVDLRLGKQQRVWGSTDGFAVLDILNPRNLREFVLEDDVRARIPTWMLAAEFRPWRGADMELVVIPDLSFHDLPANDAVFALSSSRVVPTAGDGAALPTRIRRPRGAPSHSEVAARLVQRSGPLQWSLVAMRHYNDAPRYDLVSRGGESQVELSYARSSSYGAGWSLPLGATLLRFEALRRSASPIPRINTTGDPAAGLAARHSLALGLDYAVPGGGFLSMQLLRDSYEQRAEDLPVPADQHAVTLLWRSGGLGSALSQEVFAYYSIADGDALLRPRWDWRMNDALTWRAGFDLFFGPGRDRQGVFSQFDGSSRATLEMQVFI